MQPNMNDDRLNPEGNLTRNPIKRRLTKEAYHDSGLSGYGNRERPFDYSMELKPEDGKPKFVLRITKYGTDRSNDPLKKQDLEDFALRFLELVSANQIYFEINTDYQKFLGKFAKYRQMIEKSGEDKPEYIFLNDGDNMKQMSGDEAADLDVEAQSKSVSVKDFNKRIGIKFQPYGVMRDLVGVKVATEFLFNTDLELHEISELSIGGQRMGGGQMFVDTKNAKSSEYVHEIAQRLEELGGSFSYGKINAGGNSELLVSLGPEFVEIVEDMVIFKNEEARKLVEDILKVYGIKPDFIA